MQSSALAKFSVQSSLSLLHYPLPYIRQPRFVPKRWESRTRSRWGGIDWQWQTLLYLLCVCVHCTQSILCLGASLWPTRN